MTQRNRTRRSLHGRRIFWLAGATLGLSVVTAPAAVSAAPASDCLLVLCANGEIDVDLDVDLDLPVLGDEDDDQPDPAPPPTTGAPGGVEVDLDLAADVELDRLVDVETRVPVDVDIDGRGSGDEALVDVDVDLEPEVDVDLLPQAPDTDEGASPDPRTDDPTESADPRSALAALDADLVCGLTVLAVGPSDVNCDGDVLGSLDSGLADAGVNVEICDVSVSLLSDTQDQSCASASTPDDDSPSDDDADADGDEANDDIDAVDDGGEPENGAGGGGAADVPQSFAGGATTGSTGPQDRLPRTGTTPLVLVVFAAGLLVTGAAIRWTGRRPVDIDR